MDFSTNASVVRPCSLNAALGIGAMILALDIGGTKVAIATYAAAANGLSIKAHTRYKTHDFSGLEALLQHHFAGSVPPLQAISIGVAGPVLGRVVTLTNLPWSIDADRLSQVFGAPVFLLNDLEAHGYAIPCLDPSALVTLQSGTSRQGNMALIAAGTGLGEALLIRNGHEFVVCASEGGHASFAPTEIKDLELVRFLRPRFPHISWERIVSGLEGFRNLYDYMLASGDFKIPEQWQRQLAAQHDIGALIFQAASEGESFAKYLLNWFVRLYGSEAGNLALKVMAVEGVYIAGGIASHLLPYLTTGAFTKAFAHKGRFNSMLREIPICVITDVNAALLGAAVFATKRLEGKVV